MNMNRLIFFCTLIFISGCSESTDTANHKSMDENATAIKVSPNNPYSSQIDALNTAKQVGAAAQKSIDNNYKKLEDAQH